ncbi:hypothetical protein ACOMHN_028106 [Nucella lapillus]
MSGYSLFAFLHMVISLDEPDSKHHFMVYLTNWTYLVKTLFFFLGFVLAVCCFFWPRYFNCLGAQGLSKDVEKSGTDNPVYEGNTKTQDGLAAVSLGTTRVHVQPASSPGSEVDWAVSLPWYVQGYWCLSNVIQVMALVVTVTYFGALYSASQGVSLLDLNVHGISSVMIVIDVVVCARPVRLMHVLYPLLYGMAYVIFSAIYWSQDHVNNVLYPNVLDWNYPGPTCGVVVGLALVGIPLLQLVHYGVYRLRLCCHSRIYGESYL